MFIEEKDKSDAAAEEEAAVFDAFAGGYPVPPMPHQQGVATRSISGQEH
jgi:NADH-quinone oxidoreductase subunit H